jgi:hypothetical protein
MNNPLALARSFAVVIPTLVLAGALLGCAAGPSMCMGGVASAPRSTLESKGESHAHASKPPAERHVFRLDFVVSTTEVSKPVASSTYTLNLEEERSGELHLGNNIALSSQARQDVGLKIHCVYEMVGDDLLLHNSTEMSSFDDPPSIRKISTSGDAVVAPGKLALIDSLEDPTTHRRYEVAVTATKLR